MRELPAEIEVMAIAVFCLMVASASRVFRQRLSEEFAKPNSDWSLPALTIFIWLQSLSFLVVVGMCGIFLFFALRSEIILLCSVFLFFYIKKEWEMKVRNFFYTKEVVVEKVEKPPQ